MLLLSHVPPEQRTLAAHFLAGFEREVETLRSIYFGKCNYHCPGCKEHLDSGAKADWYPTSEVLSWCQDALNRGQRLRLLGGDPCMHPQESKVIADWAMAKGHKISLAHNGSSPSYMTMMAPYLEHCGIDIKGSNPAQYAKIAGLSEERAKMMLEKTLQIIRMLCDRGVLVDVRQVVPSWVTPEELRETARLVSITTDNRAFLTLRQYQHFDGNEPFDPFASDKLLDLARELSRKHAGLAIGVNEQQNFTVWKNGEQIYCSESCFHAARAVS